MTRPSQTSHTSRGYLTAFAAAIVLSTTAIFIRHLSVTYRLPALVLAFWRELIVVVTLLVVLTIRRRVSLRVDKRHLAYLLVYGFVLWVFNALWTTSVVLNGAAVSTVLVYCSGAFTALLGRWLLKEHLGIIKLTAVVLSFGGCALVAGANDPAVWQGNIPGIIVGILAGLAYAVYSLMGRTAANRGLNAWVTIMYTFAFAAGFMLVANLAEGGKLPGTAPTPADMFWLGDRWAGWGCSFCWQRVLPWRGSGCTT
jgi:drug/metabolite transporter (DMT)-like permease